MGLALEKCCCFIPLRMGTFIIALWFFVSWHLIINNRDDSTDQHNKQVAYLFDAVTGFLGVNCMFYYIKRTEIFTDHCFIIQQSSYIQDKQQKHGIISIYYLQFQYSLAVYLVSLGQHLYGYQLIIFIEIVINLVTKLGAEKICQILQYCCLGMLLIIFFEIRYLLGFDDCLPSKHD